MKNSSKVVVRVIKQIWDGFVKVNCGISKYVCTHLMGTEHTLIHRITVGSIFMLVGVLVGKLHFGVAHADDVATAVGGSIHAIGCTPIVEAFTKSST